MPGPSWTVKSKLFCIQDEQHHEPATAMPVVRMPLEQNQSHRFDADGILLGFEHTACACSDAAADMTCPGFHLMTDAVVAWLSQELTTDVHADKLRSSARGRRQPLPSGKPRLQQRPLERLECSSRVQWR